MKTIIIVAFLIAIGIGLAKKLLGLVKITAIIAIVLFVLDYVGVLNIL